jgi:heat shock protein HtpX
MFINQLKTALLLGTLSGICLLLGQLIGGHEGLIIALIFALLLNCCAYFFSDKLVLRLYKAQPLDPHIYQWIYTLVEELIIPLHLPMPKLWLVTTPVANAFATGRNPKHASIALTTGILELLNPEELRGVLAHELSHVYNRDILVSTLAAVMASTIGYLANIIRWNSLTGRSTKDKNNNVWVAFIIGLLMPFITLLLQLAISRSREYLADETGAEVCKDPLALADALEKIHQSARSTSFNSTDTARAATAHLFIINPFTSKSLLNLFSTHPPLEKRIERLKKIFEKQHLA